MTLMLPATLGGVTLDHVRPPSRVTCTSRVLVPAQITLAFTGDGASAVIEPPAAGAPTPVPTFAAAAAASAFRGAARSGLMMRQCCPASSDTNTFWLPMYNRRGFCGENASGGAPPKRSVAV